MQIQVATKDDITLNNLEIITTNTFLPYNEYGIPVNQLTNYVIGELKDSLEKGYKILLAKQNGNVVGLLSCGKSEWDSNHFGVDIATIKYPLTDGSYYEKRQCARELLAYLPKVSKFSLEITRSHTEDTAFIHALEDSSFHLMDTLVTHYFDFKNKVSDLKETCRIEPLKDEMPELKTIAKTSFSETKVATDHFHADHRLDQAKSDALYEKWIEEAGKDKDSIVLVARINSNIVGFITCKIYNHLNSYLDKKIGGMILSAVSPKYRHYHVYTSMLQSSLKWFSDKVDIVELGTQIANYPVQRTWPKLGTMIVRSQNTWHRWT